MMRFRPFMRVSNRFRYWFMVLTDSRMDRSLRRFDLYRMTLSRKNRDLVFFLFNSFVMSSNWSMMLRWLVMYGYFLMSYCCLCRSFLRSWLLVNLVNNHRCVMMWLLNFMDRSFMVNRYFMVNGSRMLNRSSMVYRSWSVFMYRYNFMLLNHWMLNWDLLLSLRRHLMLDTLSVLGSFLMLR